jgi:hypothetical protein
MASSEAKGAVRRDLYSGRDFSLAAPKAPDNNGFSPCQPLQVPFADYRPMPHAGAKAHRTSIAQMRRPSAGSGQDLKLCPCYKTHEFNILRGVFSRKQANFDAFALGGALSNSARLP